MIDTHKRAYGRQETYFRKTMGLARFACNGALHHWQQPHAAEKAIPSWSKPSDVRPQLTAPKCRLATRAKRLKIFFSGISRKTLGWRHA